MTPGFQRSEDGFFHRGNREWRIHHRTRARLFRRRRKPWRFIRRDRNDNRLLLLLDRNAGTDEDCPKAVFKGACRLDQSRRTRAGRFYDDVLR